MVHGNVFNVIIKDSNSIFSIEILRNFLYLWIYLDEEGFNLDAGGSVDIL